MAGKAVRPKVSGPKINCEMGIASVAVAPYSGPNKFVPNSAGVISAHTRLAMNDMRPVQGIVSRTDGRSDPDHDGH